MRNKSRTQQLRGRRWFEFRTLQQPARLTAADPLPLPSSPCSPGRAFSAQIELDVNGTSRIPASSAPVAGGRARPACACPDGAVVLPGAIELCKIEQGGVPCDLVCGLVSHFHARPSFGRRRSPAVGLSEMDD